MIELDWFQSNGGWRTLSPMISLANGTNVFWDVSCHTKGIWWIHLNGCRVWYSDGSKPVICSSLHEAKCWVEDWERRALQKNMETGVTPLLNLRE